MCEACLFCIYPPAQLCAPRFFQNTVNVLNISYRHCLLCHFYFKKNSTIDYSFASDLERRIRVDIIWKS